MRKLLKVMIFAAALLPSAAQACRGPFPKPISQEQAFQQADAVFIGKVTAIMPELPLDYTPSDAKAFAERQREAERQGKPSLGRTIVFAIEKSWKGKTGDTIKLIELTPLNTCEWEQNLQLGDRVVVFAAHNGNYLTFPAGGFDGRSLYTRYDPSVRFGKKTAEHPYAQAIADETERFQKIIQSLPQ